MADNFYYAEGSTPVSSLVKTLIDEITNKASTYKWTLVYPATVDVVKDYAVVSTHNLYSPETTFYIKFERSAAEVPTAEEQALLEKDANSKPLTSDEESLIKRYIGSLDFGVFSNEVTLIEKEPGTLTTDEQAYLDFILAIRNIGADEYNLAHMYLNGEAMTTEQQSAYQVFKDAHDLTAAEVLDWNAMKAAKKITSNYIAIILVKEYEGYDLTTSEESSLATYRQSIELTADEEMKLALLKSTLDDRNHMSLTLGTEIEDKTVMEPIDGVLTEVTRKDLVADKCSEPARLAWYKDLNEHIGTWLPVQYWLNQTTDSFNLVLRGDPSADNYPYTSYLTSWCHIGAVKPVEDSAYTDDVYNFGICTSSDVEPMYSTKFGPRTGTGITDFCMVANKIGMPYQPHYAAHYSINPFMDKCNVEGSRWNMKKRQFGPITVVHPVDMERGIMQNVLVGDASSIKDTDRLAYKKDTADEERYRKFKITAPYCLFNNGPNTLAGIAIRIPLTASE